MKKFKGKRKIPKENLIKDLQDMIKTVNHLQRFHFKITMGQEIKLTGKS